MFLKQVLEFKLPSCSPLFMNALTIDIGDNVSDSMNADPTASSGIGGPRPLPALDISGPD